MVGEDCPCCNLTTLTLDFVVAVGVDGVGEDLNLGLLFDEAVGDFKDRFLVGDDNGGPPTFIIDVFVGL